MMTAEPHPILPLIGTLSSLFPPRSRGGLILVEGQKDPPKGLFTLLGMGLLEGRRVLYLDGANSFDLYRLTALARAHQADPRRLLRQILIARAFTGLELEALVARLAREWGERRADLAVVAGLLTLAVDDAVPLPEAIGLFRRTLASVEGLARRGAPLLVTADTSLPSRRLPPLLFILRQTADRVVRLEEENGRVNVIEVVGRAPVLRSAEMM